MSTLRPAVGQHVFLVREGLADLLSHLKTKGFTVIAPILRDGVVSLGTVETIADLATGMRDEQAPGSYRLVPTGEKSFFPCALGPESPRRHVFPPQMRLFSMRPAPNTFNFESGPPQPPKLAFLGIRPCDIAALQIYDVILRDVNRCESDSHFSRARQQMMVVVVNCTRPGGNCFCASMGTGPDARDGFDLSLTELRGGFVVKVGSAQGAQLAGELGVREPTSAEMELAEVRIEQARQHMGRAVDPVLARKTLSQNSEHPHWDEVAKRCLACGNCTMVCPTCFCSGIVDSNDLGNGSVSRTRLWDSCFMHQFTYTTAGPVRSSIRARYRHWLRHKLSTWWDQFGRSGCVGCGRCITWCPSGIDLTAEVAAIANNAPSPPSSRSEVSG